MNSGTWSFEDALVGSEQNDQKNGSKALRLRNSGAVRMMFDVEGAKSVSLSHAVYGKDKPVTWELRASTDGGASWKAVGSPMKSSGTTLQATTIAVDSKKNIRFEIRKTDGTPNRLNIDDFSVQSDGHGSNNGSGASASQPANPQSTNSVPSSNSSSGDVSHPPTNSSNSIHLTMGIAADGDPSDDYILERKQYALSYNKDKHVPNWVSSNLNASYFGDVPRHQGQFMPDMTLPNNLYRVRHNDYTGSGYDRGHMVRSEERTATLEDNESTFFTTNLLPQTHDMNAGPWLRLEEECQHLSQRENKELYIICGGIYAKNFPTIGKGKVAVPEKCFKIVVVLNRGQGLKDVNANTRVIAVMMPNITGIIHEGWQQYVTTVDDIERATGYDFLNALPTDVQKAIESRVGK